jgi:hypothetical protein
MSISPEGSKLTSVGDQSAVVPSSLNWNVMTISVRFADDGQNCQFFRVLTTSPLKISWLVSSTDMSCGIPSEFRSSLTRTIPWILAVRATTEYGGVVNLQRQTDCFVSAANGEVSMVKLAIHDKASRSFMFSTPRCSICSAASVPSENHSTLCLCRPECQHKCYQSPLVPFPYP